MTYYAGIDVSLETSSICIVDAQGAIRREFKVGICQPSRQSGVRWTRVDRVRSEWWGWG